MVAVEFDGLLDEFAALGAQVVGVTVDKPKVHGEWAARRGVTLPMIDDSDYEVSNAFGVTQRTGGVEHTTFLIDPDGTLVRVYSKVKPKGHAAIVLEDCHRIWG